MASFSKTRAGLCLLVSLPLWRGIATISIWLCFLSLPSGTDGELSFVPQQLLAHSVAEPPNLLGDHNAINDASIDPLQELRDALNVMQKHYFDLGLGTWPAAIDWTAAAMGTHVSATLYTLSRTLDRTSLEGKNSFLAHENIENQINKYFSQITTYYFGENAFAIRMQAYDDMLWVVLGWLSNIKFMNRHNEGHLNRTQEHGERTDWHGKQFEGLFGHRARIFWELASQGWDTRLCGGGMLWNRHLLPYKNAITNELFIAASTQMYTYFPGDDNDSPFLMSDDYPRTERAKAHDKKYLRAAIAGYDWLRSSHMTDGQGLYTDGFHIRNFGRNGSIGTGKCDERNEMVYTYNQGVLLTGLRGLWESTGDIAYLEDGHTLIRSVLAATGWHHGAPSGSLRWEGLGRNGILEEACDWHGACSQDGQTFKGIFFHHLTDFCEELPSVPLVPGISYAASPVQAALHLQSCKSYAAWVAHNARAAMRTRNKKGEFGMWWGWGPEFGALEAYEQPLNEGAIDYANDATSRAKPQSAPGLESLQKEESAVPGKHVHIRQARERADSVMGRQSGGKVEGQDINDRGRGRTVETQSGGVAVVRAMYEFLKVSASA